MPYADGRTYYDDADSHLMELGDWLVQYADPDIRDRIRPLYLGAAGALAERAVREAAARRGDPTATRELEGLLMEAKGWAALGAFDPEERSRALDLLGVAKQLVFSTFAATQFSGDDDDLLFGGTRAHNRAMAAFCAHDRRLIAVGAVPWGDPGRTVAEAREAIRLGCGALLAPSARRFPAGVGGDPRPPRFASVLLPCRCTGDPTRALCSRGAARRCREGDDGARAGARSLPTSVALPALVVRSPLGARHSRRLGALFEPGRAVGSACRSQRTRRGDQPLWLASAA
jgi:hypothetical protein